ncbi:MAG: glyoxalase [Betaproteobacteria bacterium]|jgi:catechol 2,3-dioxygenase|nr:glyoxalase [Betaproteobacteria bacterium]NDD24555.1 glyoxalase [Betaproteobacteria bacterium]
MKSPWISALRSVALTVPDLAAAEIFYTQTWGLVLAEKSQGVAYFRGSGHDHHLLALHEAAGTPQLRLVTLRARSAKALEEIAQAAQAAGGVVERTGAALDPAGGHVVVIRDPDGRRLEVVHGDALRANDAPTPQDRPIRLAHAVLNSHAVEKTREFFEKALGFVLADRTRIMAFMNCDNDHHSIALGDTDNDALNHVAFLMPTLDAVMRGGGRLKDKGLPPQWGPGRHGPGDNAFNYFVDPFGIVIEYTAEVEQIDETYRVGRPEDWTWPPGRIDQWGVGQMPTDHLKQAQRRVFFMPHLD